MASKSDNEIFKQAWAEIEILINPYYHYIEGIYCEISNSLFIGVPLDENASNSQNLVKNSFKVRQILQRGAYEGLMIESIMTFIQDICLKIIHPKIEVARGIELFQLIRDFWGRFCF
jgi:hypothetical protein